MKYWIDTEFIEWPGHLQLISIGITSEDGRVYYAISKEYDETKANEWVKRNVLSKLEPENEFPRKSLSSIARDIFTFVNPKWIKELSTLSHEEFIALHDIRDKAGWSQVAHPEFWAYYADYDWVAFCHIFGPMVSLPGGFPMYCRDLKQWMDQVGLPESLKPADPAGAHNALVDAKWNKQLYNIIAEYEKSITGIKPADVSLNDIFFKIFYAHSKQIVVQLITEYRKVQIKLAGTNIVSVINFEREAEAQEYFRTISMKNIMAFMSRYAHINPVTINEAFRKP